MFCEAVELIHEDLIDSELGYFVVRDHLIDCIDPDKKLYQLPEDLHHILFVRDQQGEIQSADKEQEGTMAGYVVVDDKIQLVSWNGRPSDQLTIHYIKWPKELPDWTGDTDPDTEEYQLDYPLSTPKAGRVLARIIQIVAETKDETATPTTMSHVSSIIDGFVNHLSSRTEVY
jgi:hypothetical protein